jgi:hypothetical protein
MAAAHSVDPVQLLEQHLGVASPDRLQQMIVSLVNAMMPAKLTRSVALVTASAVVSGSLGAMAIAPGKGTPG